jgi:hypothetical protein
VDPNPSRNEVNGSFLCVLQKRRERIKERMIILQNLVPNGTKVRSKHALSAQYCSDQYEVYLKSSEICSLVIQVDISTMLEEAVNYVKFLQLQIKVLAKGTPSLYTY